MTRDEAYRACAAITRERAGNFYHGIRLLPRAKRNALSALYAYARRVDDVADGDLAREAKLAELARLRCLLEDGEPASDEAVARALEAALQRFPIPIDALHGLVDGAEMDVRGARYKTFDDLLVYCRRVAGTIGRLCVGVFGASDRGRAMARAESLGVALQLTNILRDVREDWTLGRVYLPEEDLVRFGWTPDGLEASDAFRALVRFEAGRADVWYERGLELLPLLDRRARACVSAMAGIYRRLLQRIRRDPAAVLRERVSLGRGEKTRIALRSLLGRRP